MPTDTAVATIDKAATVAINAKAIDISKLKAKVITLPQLKLLAGREYVVRFDSKLYPGKVLKDSKNDKPPLMAKVTECSTGIACEMIINASVEKDLTENFPKDSFIGEIFQITKMEAQPTKNGSRQFCPCLLVHLAK